MAVGVTVRIAGLLATDWTRPSLQTSWNGAVPVSWTVICADWPRTMVVDPEAIPLGRTVQLPGRTATLAGATAATQLDPTGAESVTSKSVDCVTVAVAVPFAAMGMFPGWIIPVPPPVEAREKVTVPPPAGSTEGVTEKCSIVGGFVHPLGCTKTVANRMAAAQPCCPLAVAR